MLSAAAATESAIADSTRREGSVTMPRVARASVTECAT